MTLDGLQTKPFHLPDTRATILGLPIIHLIFHLIIPYLRITSQSKSEKWILKFWLHGDHLNHLQIKLKTAINANKHLNQKLNLLLLVLLEKLLDPLILFAHFLIVPLVRKNQRMEILVSYLTVHSINQLDLTMLLVNCLLVFQASMLDFMDRLVLFLHVLVGRLQVLLDLCVQMIQLK